MGAEGVNWVGESKFSTRKHVFQNIGEGTYNHSGLLAIRAALAASTNITYKILYNDAVAMTGGQPNEGGLSPEQIARELQAMGVKRIAVVYDPKEQIEKTRFPRGLEWHERDALGPVQEEMARVEGVSAILFIQTCAAEKRRRRKRGQFPDPDRRLFINTDVCEGCGDCSVQSNCVSIVPVDTPLGRKRAIDQSTCNKDYSCVKGFCPSFISVEGGTLRKSATHTVALPDLPLPDLPVINGVHNIVVTGVGGTGVVTIGALLAMAAHLDGKGAGMMEMAGLAQKGGAVSIHCRIAEKPQDINAIRVALGECDALIGGDLVVSAAARTLGLTTPGRTGAVVNNHEITTGDFTLNRDFRLPSDAMTLSLQARLRDGLTLFDASGLAAALMGDSIYSNMMVFGAAWQRGLIPLTLAAIERAIELNGTAVKRNTAAFSYGRWAVVDPAGVARITAPAVLPGSTDPHAVRLAHLEAYQGVRLVTRYTRMLDACPDPELRDAVAHGYHKVLTYKDEYEVARLLQSSRDKAAQTFDGDLRLTYHLAPPLLSRTGPDGRPVKRAFGAWIGRLFPVLARAKGLRGTPFDLFGYTAERRMERAMIKTYEQDMTEALAALTDATRAAVLELARLPLSVRGFGPVKAAAAATAAARRADLLQIIRAGGTPPQALAAE
jgi:indolepyruvate ferredoxin oxidoreductase